MPAEIDDPTLLAIMQSLGAGATGLTDRAIGRIREFVEKTFPNESKEKWFELGGWIATIVREESWGLLAAYQQQLEDEDE